ncbi:sigma factor-like helix-turn-helix DNA-binding protein [Streptomyces sp. NBC_01268]|uniref:sigma factor-like helix-turn-helix DNA-binding protein n=1 Tax=Streptomyces sp. NBC_01268 TaxID=2903806 RepID=UPI002E2FA791|nr:sigma factor-like helix-turn-helix DNA-binding protein [Streptomyces sp. NBC_01268]
MTSPAPHASTCLADLVPALRYADPHALAERLGDERLPLGWWYATPLTTAERTIGSPALASVVARALRALWPQIRTGELLPVSRLLDAEAVPPHTSAEEAGEDALAALVRALLDRLHGRVVPRAALGVPAAVAVISEWLPADAPAEVHAALAVLRELEEDPAEAPEEHGARDGAECRSAAAAVPEPVALPVQRVHEEAAVSPAAEAGEPAAEDAAEEASEPRASEAADSEAQLDRELPATHPNLMDTPLAAFDAYASTWGERERAIAARRIFAEQPETFAALGDRFEVSRERVRQLERSVLDSIAQWLAYDEQGHAFAAHLAAVAGRLGAVGRLAEVRAMHPDHSRSVDALGLPLGVVVARLLPDRAVDGEWIVQGDTAALRTAMADDLLATCGETPLAWDEAVAFGERHGVRAEVLADWAAEIGRFKTMDGHLLHWGRSVNDRAMAVLSLRGEPMSMEDIHDRLADGTTINSMRNQIWTDERFVRLDRNLYGLRQWGGEEYLGIREMITREIQQAGGEIEVNALVDAICGRFDVVPASVRTNLAAPEFTRTRRGWVGLAAEQHRDGQAAPYNPRKDVARTRRCFVGTDGRWWYRFEVTGDHLRGSGAPVPSGWAAHLGAAPACEPIPLRHEAGESALQWRTQPVLGSIRPLMEHIGASVGDQVFLNVTDGELRALRLPAAQPEARPEARAARLTGWTAAVTMAEAIDVIGLRTGMGPGQEATALLQHLGDRGDRDIVGLLEQALTGTVPVN